MMTSNHAGMLESLCPAKDSLPPVQVHSSQIFITYISPTSLRYAEDAEDTLTVIL